MAKSPLAFAPAKILTHPHFDRPAVENPKTRQSRRKIDSNGCYSFKGHFYVKRRREFENLKSASPTHIERPVNAVIDDHLRTIDDLTNVTVGRIFARALAAKELIRAEQSRGAKNNVK